MDAQADLNLRWAHMFEGTFSDVAAQLKPVQNLMNEFVEMHYTPNDCYIQRKTKICTANVFTS